MKRIQRKRTKGWRMPENTVFVGRPSRWGNPYRVGASTQDGQQIRDRAHAVAKYRELLAFMESKGLTIDTTALRGKDIACWCPLDEPCHADVLIEMTNQSDTTRISE